MSWGQKLKELERGRVDALHALMALVGRHYHEVPTQVQAAYHDCVATMHDTLDHVRSRVNLSSGA